MTVEDLFETELARSPDHPDDVPTDRIARACAVALDVDGAGLSYSLAPDRRLPLGASDDTAALAERLQFALGSGPCITAQRTGTVVRADPATLAQQWPAYALDLTTRTPYRHVVALAVGGPFTAAITLDLYCADEHGTPATVEDLRRVADLAGAALVETLLAEPDGVELSAMLNTPTVVRRERVWVAIGYLGVQHELPAGSATALLRSFAFARDLDLETAADRVLAGDGPTP